MARYLISDLHGRYDLYQEVEKFRKTGDKIICLGDCGDRGPKSYETCLAVANNPDWMCLMGNHEHMMLEALKEECHGIISRWYIGAYETVVYNGGYSTFEGMVGEADKWIKHFKSLPYRLDLVNEMGYRMILTHAGFDMARDEADDYDYIWDRSHFDAPWPTGRKYENVVMVHGHTPIPYLDSDWTPFQGSKQYADGHKINIDCGSVWTGATVLLNLDTLDEHIFDLGGNSNDS